MAHTYDGSVEEAHDRKLIAQLRDNGIDVNTEYPLTHYFYFTGESGKEHALTVQAGCIRRGYTTEIEQSEQRTWIFFRTPLWTVRARTTSTVTEEAIRAESMVMMDVANEANVRYDGWDVAIRAPAPNQQPTNL